MIPGFEGKWWMIHFKLVTLCLVLSTSKHWTSSILKNHVYVRFYTLSVVKILEGKYEISHLKKDT
jgi:hypothetical protein